MLYKQLLFQRQRTNDTRTAVGRILQDYWRVYEGSKEYKVPYNKPKKRALITPPAKKVPVLKREWHSV
jgi:hypothetical protein